jgi:hypothetical protein
MSEKFEPSISRDNPEEVARREGVEDKINHLHIAFGTAELALKEKGRDLAKGYLPDIYTTLVVLNKLDPAKVINPLEHWNPEGDLTEAQFNELNLRRKILSNAIGIMTGSGKVRHDLNPDVPQSLE